MRRICLAILGMLLLTTPLYAQDVSAVGAQPEPRSTKERLARRSKTILMVGIGTAAVFIVLALSGWLTPRKPEE